MPARAFVQFLAAAIIAAVSCKAAGDLRLLDAIKRRDRKAVESLTGERAGINAALPDGSTPLAWAAYLGDRQTAEILIAAGANVNAADEYGETPLTLACANGDAVLVDKLLKAGANANAARWNGETALMIAAGAGSSEAIKLLAAQGAKVNAVEQRKGQSALMWAAAEGHSDVVETLIKLGADVKAASNTGFSALVFAAMKNDGKSITSLIATGADPNYTLPSGTKTLQVAASHQSALAMNALVELGAEPNIADSNGNTPLHVAAQLGDAGLIATLLKKGANPNVRTAATPAGRATGGGGFRRPAGELTALHVAARARHEDAIRALVAGGADPLLNAQGGTTLLMAAASGSSVGVVKYVYDQLDKRVDAVTDTGSTVMHAAVVGTLGVYTQTEICDVIRFLANSGAKADEKDSSGRTPLQIASRAPVPKEQVVQLLTGLAAKAAPKDQ
jgi:ankyrin repeat protein